MSGDVILATADLTKEFKGFTAVNGVTLTVRRGTIHALIGPNGAGKTTCFNLLTKFLPPTRGTIRYDERAMALLEDVGLTAYAGLQAAQLPYGRKRALEIATTLALDPVMMLLDEPTAGMTHEDVDRIVALVKRVSAGRTVLLVEHNLSVVASLSSFITVLARGSVLAEGEYASVSKNPKVIEAYIGAGGHG